VDQEYSNRFVNVVGKLRDNGIDAVVVGSVFNVCGFPTLGFHVVVAKDKVTPDIMRLAEIAWDSEMPYSEWREVVKKGFGTTWWTFNGEDSVGEFDFIVEVLEDWLKSEGWTK